MVFKATLEKWLARGEKCNEKWLFGMALSEFCEVEFGNHEKFTLMIVIFGLLLLERTSMMHTRNNKQEEIPLDKTNSLKKTKTKQNRLALDSDAADWLS